jgi:hypothetical protein
MDGWIKASNIIKERRTRAPDTSGGTSHLFRSATRPKIHPQNLPITDLGARFSLSSYSRLRTTKEGITKAYPNADNIVSTPKGRG